MLRKHAVQKKNAVAEASRSVSSKILSRANLTSLPAFTPSQRQVMRRTTAAVFLILMLYIVSGLRGGTSKPAVALSSDVLVGTDGNANVVLGEKLSSLSDLNIAENTKAATTSMARVETPENSFSAANNIVSAGTTFLNKPKKKKPSEATLIKPAPPLQIRSKTDTGVDVSDPELYKGVDLNGDSSTATVMGMASGYDLDVYERFVGSLRNSGYKGHIFLGVAPDVSPSILKYFERRNVVPKIQTWVNCTYKKESNKGNDIFKKTTCAHPYPDIKIRWSRFPLQRDWLRDCKTCTGPVLVLDVRDSVFQLDPFGPGSPVVNGLQVYEEHKNQTTQHWLTEWPIRECKGITYKETMLCSGTTVGTRAAMLKYLEIMYEEMKVWIADSDCRFDINGDDQSIHNHLYYSGQLPFAQAVANRAGGIVNTVGVEAAIIFRQQGNPRSFASATGNQWIGSEFKLTDNEGFFTEADGTRSRVIHQWDRFGPPYFNWLKTQSFAQDSFAAA